MAIRPQDQYPSQTLTDDAANYPHGKARNIAAPGDGLGTPWEAAGINDIYGFLQSLLNAGGITPNGNPDSVGNAQYLAALQALISAASGISQGDADARYLLESNNLSDLTNASSARTALGLGSVATQNSSAFTNSLLGLADAAAWLAALGAGAGGGATVTAYTSPGSGTHTSHNPGGRALIIAAGAGGGGQGQRFEPGNGGGAGGFSIGVITSTASAYSYTVGAGGAGGPSSSSDSSTWGTNGGTTSFGTVVTCAGGTGGRSTAISGNPIRAGGAASGGIMNIRGGNGSFIESGQGGGGAGIFSGFHAESIGVASRFGSGGGGDAVTSGTGGSGQPGCGGGGGVTGGTGGNGFIIIVEY